MGLRFPNTWKFQSNWSISMGAALDLDQSMVVVRGRAHFHGPHSHSISWQLINKQPEFRYLVLKHASGMASERATQLPNNKNGFLHWWNQIEPTAGFPIFPGARYDRETSTTEVAIQTNPMTDLHYPSGARTGLIMNRPFISLIRIGWLLASWGGARSWLSCSFRAC